MPSAGGDVVDGAVYGEEEGEGGVLACVKFEGCVGVFWYWCLNITRLA